MTSSKSKKPNSSLLTKAVTPIQEFMKMEASGGIVLMLATVVALLMANSEAAGWYFSFINTPFSIGLGESVLNKTLLLLVNDGLMAVFFYLVGLEIKREIMVGELSTVRKASFSIFAAIGGMVVPALVYVLFNTGSTHIQGWGIPMATDIAFAIGILTLLGKRVPLSLKVFLLALAIVDDLGAVLIIALFYSKGISFSYLGLAGLSLAILFLLNRAGMRNIVWGLCFGVFTWFFFLKSGVHATIAGVILAFLTPSKRGPSGNSEENKLLLDDYIHGLHPWIAFLIMPVFAFFNAGVSFKGVDFVQLFGNTVFLGIAAGLLIGKPVGIFLVTRLATALGLAKKPDNISWTQVVGVGFLAGIGFTMSLFISSLAFDEGGIQTFSKMGILFGSLVSMFFGYFLLNISLRKKAQAGSDS